MIPPYFARRLIFTTNIHTRKMSDIIDVLSKLWLDLCQILNFSPLQDSISVQLCCNEALYPPMIDTAVPDGTITKVWQPFTTNMHTRKVSGINDVLPKLGLDFCQRIIEFLTLTRLNISAAMLQWGTVFRQWLIQQARWDHYQGLTTLYNQHEH